MWERSQLKERAKVTFKRCYWKAVLVSFIAFMLTGGMGQVANNANEMKDTYNSTYSENYTEEYEDTSLDLKGGATSIFENIFADGLVMLFVSVFVVAIILSLLIKLLIAYPITIGKNNYFMGIRHKEKPVKNILFLYKSGKLKSSIFTMFMMDLFIYLWSLLLLIPGIVKSYEYRMIPYILSENPNISRTRAFEISKNMMYGNKWSVFELDLSFLGWYILSALTLGLLSIFYVNPYVESTNAELYAFLREEALEKGYAEESELIGF
ncbi:DUF975 family protein [Terrisporobacter mayombei]|uniref:DUF975 domain-containing protein n=1 Tax=Terrisporobacter mayombei TaxID=1541 RepID=A0ABY9PX09_9FIRM|nr:DUF975 family protein [Terrisporobacter mayombei]MCC3868056.1 DUF975 family protein [Terrisporobacter mayombei]WMT80192.1 hypothetical protein TEMA_05050 [Terrisporobacter mayombei]